MEAYFYKCLSLAWLISSHLSLTYTIYLLPLGFYLSLFLCIFSSLFIPCLAVLGGWPLFLLLDLSSQISPIYSFCLSVLPILFANLLLAVQLSIRLIRCFRQSNTASSQEELNKCKMKECNTSLHH